MLGLTVPQAYTVLFLLCLPVCLYVAWSDLKFMKIPNRAVIALLAIFVVAGLAVIPFEAWLWRWLNLAIVFAIGFALYALAGWGAGDAKFAAAAAPFFAQSVPDIQLAMFLLAGMSLGALGAHRLLRLIPAVTRATPDWKSWTHARFPFGTALAGTLLAYLALKAFPPFYLWLSGLFAVTST
ncbi:MAG: prepilin peptidase [Rhodobacteraceae bacterium]|nr:prepilin peptidase [Paracoccaceae bacterium]